MSAAPIGWLTPSVVHVGLVVMVMYKMWCRPLLSLVLFTHQSLVIGGKHMLFCL